MKRRVRQNRWGNWNGYAGTRRVESFGLDLWEAREWLATGKRSDRQKTNVTKK